jgi:hypothetical protein
MTSPSSRITEADAPPVRLRRAHGARRLPGGADLDPEQEAPSDWVLPFEILGPEQERIESAVHGLDAVQALHCGLQRIAVELQSLQERAGGTLTLFEKEGLGFAPP